MALTNFLNPASLSISTGTDGALRLTLDGQQISLAPPRRSMPLSTPDQYIILSEEEGSEIGVLRDVNELDEASREALQYALKQAYRLERITRILEVEKEALTGHTRWRVEIETEPASEDGTPTGDAAATAADANGTTTAPIGVDGDGTNGTAREDGKLLSRLLPLRRSPEDALMDVATEEREFHISGQEDVQTARYPHIFIVDTDRNRYEILNCETLDIESRRAAERFF